MIPENYSRRKFLKTIGKGTLVAGSLPFFKQKLSGFEEMPNILFIMSDDHAKRAISCYGSDLLQTPNIDKIAREGVLFTNSFVTNSICAPSRAVLLTGKYSHLNGLKDNNDVFDGNQQTFPKLLKQSGYQTAMIGKWHLKSKPTGFDNWSALPGQGDYYNPEFIEKEGQTQYPGYVTEIITDKAIDFLEKRNVNKPFCMLVHHKAPHRNFMPPLKNLGIFKDKKFPLPPNFFDEYQSRKKTAGTADMRIEDMFLSFDFKLNPEDYSKQTGSGGSGKIETKPQTGYKNRLNKQQREVWEKYYDQISKEFKKLNLSGRELLKWKYQRYLEDYLACILSVDENIGRLLKYLKENGLEQNTLVVYTSDQGFYLGEHGWYDKRFMYEESLGMPLVIRYPKAVKRGQINEKIVLNLDFAPTFLDFANLNIPDDMQGESLCPLLLGKKADNWRTAMYYHYFEYPQSWHFVKRHYGIRTKRYKLIHFYYDVDQWELYDLQNDPHEMNNLYHQNQYRSLIKELKEQLNHLRIKYKDLDEKKYLPLDKTKVEHRGVGAEVTHKFPWSEKYPGTGKNSIVNGYIYPDGGDTPHGFRDFQGFEGTNIEAVIDLGKPFKINSISSGFIQNVGSWIFAPREVTFYHSDKRHDFRKIITVKSKVSQKKTGEFRVTFTCRNLNLQMRYIKVVVKTLKQCPKWHKSAGQKSWTFIDQVIVK